MLVRAPHIRKAKFHFPRLLKLPKYVRGFNRKISLMQVAVHAALLYWLILYKRYVSNRAHVLLTSIFSRQTPMDSSLQTAFLPKNTDL